jgi:hypothetical protein
MIDAQQYIGLSKQSSQDRAEAQNLVWRLISVDGEPFFSYPQDTRDDRICVEIVGGRVVKAIIQ